jgi:hypothetical protein
MWMLEGRRAIRKPKNAGSITKAVSAYAPAAF